MVDNGTMDFGDVDWGNVPGWLGAFSLLLAFAVFLRDRGNTDRSQVDCVGAWAVAAYEVRSPWDQLRTFEGKVTGYLRNASQLPVRVAQVAWRIESSWSVEDKAQSRYPHGVGVWAIVNGPHPGKSFHNDVRVPPQDTIKLPFGINVGHLAPEGASQLAAINGLAVHVEWMLLVDNAGRRWEVRPEKSGRAKRVRRWWKPKEYMPANW